MTQDPNATRESIKDFILSWPFFDNKQLHLKRSSKLYDAPTTAALVERPGPSDAVLERGNGKTLWYPGLDALLDDGWMID
jgi:hypothetical protein